MPLIANCEMSACAFNSNGMVSGIIAQSTIGMPIARLQAEIEYIIREE